MGAIEEHSLFYRHHLGHNAGGIYRVLLTGVPCPVDPVADRVVPAVHGAVLDIEHYPDDSAAGQGRLGHNGAD
jgi:hypothetical protein